jgi:parvulin-like peptidyl-prolyl isomerase
MDDPGPVIAALGDTRLTLNGLVAWLREQGRLWPLVREALAARYVADQAGPAPTAEELQAAADDFRRRNALESAADTRAWLARHGMTADDFEATLTRDLLTARLRQRLTADKVDAHFAAHRAGFERLRLARVLAPREDLARELVSQVRDEGRSLDEAAREQGLAVDRAELFRRQLAGPVEAAVGSAGAGDLVGPVATPRGFVLALVESRRPAELDAATRRAIADELFDGWLAEQMAGARLGAGRPESG